MGPGEGKIQFPTLPGPMLHSLLAVFAGFTAMALLVILSTALAATLLVPGGMSATAANAGSLPRAYLIVNLGCSALAAFIGGAITASLAYEARLWHGAALAALMVAMSVLSARQAKGTQPRWYQLTLMTAMPLIALTGAWSIGSVSRIG